MAYKLRASDESVLICEGARVSGDVTLGRGVSVWYNAVLRGDDGAITVGEDTNIQDGAVLHEETRVGAGCTIGHNAIVHGCTVGDNTLIGLGAQRRQDRPRLRRGRRGAGHRKDGRPGRLHDPGQSCQGGAGADGGGDRRQPEIRPGVSGGGGAVPPGRCVTALWSGTGKT